MGSCKLRGKSKWGKIKPNRLLFEGGYMADNNTIKIGNRIVGDGHPAYIIAEMSANHAGSLDRAKEIIHAAKEAGADCLKIQTYTPDTITMDCDNEYFHIEDGTWEGEYLYSLYGKAYTPWDWQPILKEEADKVGIDFLSTPFDNTAVDFLDNMGMLFYKIASFELVDIPLIKYTASKGKPIIMSTGMGSIEEIQEALEAIYSTGNRQVALLKCSSAYPADPKEMHLSNIADMKARFNVPVGLSDHSMGHRTAAMSVALGGSIIEKHFCLGRDIENPDASFSMTPDEFAQMVKEVRLTEQCMGNVSYGPTSQEKTNYSFRKSIFVTADINAGDVISPQNVRVIRPGYGLKPKYYEEVIGKTATCDISRGTPLLEEMVSGFNK